ncbi:MAG: rhomboid family intramembrane serine protease, partial [Polyangiaceae bacterium]
MLPIRDINPTRSTPYLTYAFIALNILVFLGQSGLAMLGVQGLGFTFGVVPARFVADPLLEAPTILSSMFLHASFGHLAGNMLFLYIFGDNIEDALGKLRFGVFYLLSGVAGALAQVLID